MNYLAISGLTTAICGTLCAFFLYFSSPIKDTKKVCALYNLAMALWGLGFFISFSTLNPNIALFWSKFLNTSAILIPVLFFHFVLLLTNKVQHYKKEMVIYMTISFIFFVLAIVFNDHFIHTVTQKMSFKLYPTSGALYYFFPIQYGYLALRAILILISEFKNSSGLRKEQLKYILLGNAIGFMGGGTTFFLVFDINIYPFGVILVPFYLMLQTYSIIKYRLMDIQLAITSVGIFTFIYSLVLGIPFSLAMFGQDWLRDVFGEYWFITPMGLLFLFATAGPSLYLRFQRRAEEKILREEIRYQEKIQTSAYSLSQNFDLKDLCNVIANLIVDNVCVKNTTVFVRNDKNGKFFLTGAKLQESTDLIINEVELSDECEDIWRTNPKPIQKDEISFLKLHESRSDEIIDLFQKLKAEIIVPGISTKDAKPYLSNFIAVGEKINSRLFSKGDVNTFAVLGLHSTIAIHNAINYAHEQEQRAKLFQTETLAKLGTMANSMGHQIKNYLQKIVMMAGADSGVSKEILKGTPDQKLLRDQLNEVVETLDEITNQGRKAGDLIATFSNFSQLPNSDFAWLTIEKLLEDTKGILRFKIKMESFELESDIDPRIGSVWAHPIMVEAFLNLLDNAHDAMQERARIAGDNLDEYKPRVLFKAILEGDNDVIITIQDNGIGVKEEHLGRLFVPFYTTKATSAKGTGLGLYVIKEIIDQHKGTIQCHSEHMKGTTFTLKIPKNFNTKKI